MMDLPGIPGVRPFDSTGFEQFPRVFCTADEARLARERANTPAGRPILEALIAEAEQALKTPTEPLDESWWPATSTQPWADTYPVIFRHTAVEPGKPARAAQSLAVAWLLTGDPRFADKAGDLLAVLSGYQFVAEHFDVGLNYATWNLPLLQAYDILGARMAPAERRAMDEFFGRLAIAEARNDQYWIEHNIGGGLNNHLAWHKMMLGLLGLFYERPALVDYCINGPRGLLPLLGDGLLDDGLWCESSLNYHFTTIIPAIIFADAQRRCGSRPTLFDMRGANGRTLRQPFDAILRTLAPNRLIPPIGDTYANHMPIETMASIYEYAWQAWQDPTHAWVLRLAKERKTLAALISPPLPEQVSPPPIRSVLMPEHGYAFLRSHEDEAYWSDAARCAMLNFDDSNVHTHFDKPSLMLFGQGRMLLSDVEAKASSVHAFSSQVQRELNRSTLCHNTVMIGGFDQRHCPRRLELIEYRDTPHEKRITAADRDGLLYAHVTQMRTVILTPGYVLDVFQVRCPDQQQIDWLAHVMGPAESVLPEEVGETTPFELPSSGPWAWLRDARRLPQNDAPVLTWVQDGARLRLRLRTEPQASLIHCRFPEDDRPDSPTGVPMLIVRHQATKATIVALWTQAEPDDTFELDPPQRADRRLLLRVRRDRESWLHHVPALA